MINAVTIDVEDYFHVAAFAAQIKPEDWNCFPLRVADNTLRILDLLDIFSIRATFFVLGWIAERCPDLIKEISRRQHEIASHGYRHELVYVIGPERFRQDVRKSKQLLEEVCGKSVIGYRAPSYSITKQSLWALDILMEEGFTYDSSIFPILHDVYGIPHASRFPHDVVGQSGKIKEFPLSTLNLKLANLEYRLPVAGGGYLRLFPKGLIKRAIHHINTIERQPAVLYFHPWEIDPDQPRIQAPLKSRFRHYLNLDTTLHKIKYLFGQFSFSSMGTVLGYTGQPELPIREAYSASIPPVGDHV